MSVVELLIRKHDREALDDSVVELYRRTFLNSEVYRERFTAKEASDNLKQCELLVVARSKGTEIPIAFGGGYIWDDKYRGKHRIAYEAIREQTGQDRVFFVADFGVCPKYQGNRVGVRLMQFLMQQVQSEGCLASALITNLNNRPALSLYSRHFGFRFVHVNRNPLKISVSQARSDGSVSSDQRPYLYSVSPDAVMREAHDLTGSMK